MFLSEKKYLSFLKKYFMLFFIVIVTFCAVLVRYSMRDFLSLDAKDFLLPWFDDIANSGKLAGLNMQVGNYNMLYQFIIAVMTYIPIDPLYLYKILSCFFDFILAFGVFLLVFKLTNNKILAGFSYAFVVFSPIVVLNSAAWGQCDSIFVSFIIFSIIAILEEKNILSFIFLGISFAFKFQAIFILPFFLFLYLYKKSYSIINFFIIPIVMIILSLPNIIMGRDIIDIFLIYFKQTDMYKNMYLGYPSFWAIFCDTSERTYFLLKFFAIILTLFLISSLIYFLIKLKVKFNNSELLFIAFLLTYTCILFLPAMHERYGFCYEILALTLAFVYRKTVPALLAMYSITFTTYGHYLFGVHLNIQVLAVLNLAMYIFCFSIFIRRIIFKCNQQSHIYQF